MKPQELVFDHLVVAAATLAQGVLWCESTLGVKPGAGGQHPLMGTYNRLLNISSAAFPACYLEIIAINPDAPAPDRARWFGLDDPGLQERLQTAPQFIHAVARTSALARQIEQLRQAGHELGETIAASRDTPQGRLAWEITVPKTGALPGAGCLPTIIQWQGVHPTEHMAPSGVSLSGLRWCGLTEPVRGWLGLTEPSAPAHSSPGLQASFITPRGDCVLHSQT